MILEGGGSGGKMALDKQGNKKQQHLICFPMESLLAAINQYEVDFFSLDIEGLDYEVLSNFPFDAFDIKVGHLLANRASPFSTWCVESSASKFFQNSKKK